MVAPEVNPNFIIANGTTPFSIIFLSFGEFKGAYSIPKINTFRDTTFFQKISTEKLF